MATELEEALRLFGPPIYVPASPGWRVAGVEWSKTGVPDGVLVRGSDGAVSVRTESSSRTEQPLSIRVANIQIGSAPQQSMDTAWRAVVVTEAEADIPVAGEERRVRLLKSHRVFSFELQLGARRLSVGGEVRELESLALVELQPLSLSG